MLGSHGSDKHDRLQAARGKPQRTSCAQSSVLFGLVLALVAPAFAQSEDARSGRVDRLNQAFLLHVRALAGERAIASATVLDGWENTYRGQLAESFVPDALAVLYPTYREALQAFDEDRPADVVRLLDPLRGDEDPFLAANATYFHVRALVELGRYEQAETGLASLEALAEQYARHTPYAPHLWFVRAFCEARDLRFQQATETLAALRSRFADAPEAVRVGAAQLALELERRERGTLDEVATVMDYVADRLDVTDAGTDVQKRQLQVIAMLDRLIEQHEQQESQCGGGQARGQPQGTPRAAQGKPKQESDAPGGAGRIGDLHAAPEASPGEMWGKLPPAEREKILQSIRAKYPSRYRQLVEQYYRALGGEE